MHQNVAMHNEFVKWLGHRENSPTIKNGSNVKAIRELQQFMAIQNQQTGAPVLLLFDERYRFEELTYNALIADGIADRTKST